MNSPSKKLLFSHPLDFYFPQMFLQHFEILKRLFISFSIIVYFDKKLGDFVVDEMGLLRLENFSSRWNASIIQFPYNSEEYKQISTGERVLEMLDGSDLVA